MTDEQQSAIARIDRQIADLYTQRANVLEQLVDTNAEPSAARPIASTKPRETGLITLKEASEIMRTPVETIRYWIWKGRLKKTKPGRFVFVREADVRALLKG